VRKVTFWGANSLDNFIARPDLSVDWLLWSKEAAAIMTDYWKTIDTVLMGRKTYQVALRSGKGARATQGRRPRCSRGSSRRAPTGVLPSSGATPSNSSGTRRDRTAGTSAFSRTFPCSCDVRVFP
jgi:hypothetical protein